MKAVIVGCGNIAVPYARDIVAAGVVDLVGFYDMMPERAKALASVHGGEVFETLEDAAASADLIVNLTIFEAHYPVSKLAIESGCHVYSEKPLAMSLDEANELNELAKANDVRLVAAPFTFLGNAQRKAIRAIRSGDIGEARLVYAEVNHGRIETWHPNPEPFYAAGPMLDVGVYPLTLVTAALGPVESLTAISKKVLEDRTTLEGKRFRPAAPDYWLVDLQLVAGVSVRLTANFYVHGHEGMSFHGDMGSLHLSSWFSPEATVTFNGYDQDPVVVSKGDDSEIDWSAGIVDLVASIEAGTRSALSTEHSVHLVEIIDATNESTAEHRPVELSTRFSVPEL